MSSNPTINLENPPKKLDVEEVAKSLQHFEFIDYSMFALMLIICSGIGIYFGYKDHKLHQMQKRSRLRVRRGSEALEYLVGSRNLQVFPVSMSLVASYVSGITLLGMSTEIYYYGAQFFQILIAAVLMSIYLYYVIIPVFHDLKITSTYEVSAIEIPINAKLN
jgi:Na+/proline symporter